MDILADTQTRILFRQSSDQVPEATALLGLTNVEAEILPRLARGRALWRVGDHTAIVQHRIGSAEGDICDTDGRLTVYTATTTQLLPPVPRPRRAPRSVRAARRVRAGRPGLGRADPMVAPRLGRYRRRTAGY